MLSSSNILLGKYPVLHMHDVVVRPRIYRPPKRSKHALEQRARIDYLRKKVVRHDLYTHVHDDQWSLWYDELCTSLPRVWWNRPHNRKSYRPLLPNPVQLRMDRIPEPGSNKIMHAMGVFCYSYTHFVYDHTHQNLLGMYYINIRDPIMKVIEEANAHAMEMYTLLHDVLNISEQLLDDLQSFDPERTVNNHYALIMDRKDTTLQRMLRLYEALLCWCVSHPEEEKILIQLKMQCFVATGDMNLLTSNGLLQAVQRLVVEKEYLGNGITALDDI